MDKLFWSQWQLHLLILADQIGVFQPEINTEISLGSHKQNPLYRKLLSTFHLITSAMLPTLPHPLPTTQPTLHSLFAEASPCILAGCLEDRGAIRYQRSLPCFNTEQMNGLHAISLKEENSKAERRRRGFVKCPQPWPALHHTYRS